MKWSSYLLIQLTHQMSVLYHDNMEMVSVLQAFFKGTPQVTSGFPTHMASNVKLWCFLCYYPKMLNKQLSCQWFETVCPLYGYCNEVCYSTNLGSEHGNHCACRCCSNKWCKAISRHSVDNILDMFLHLLMTSYNDFWLTSFKIQFLRNLAAL